MTKSQNNCTKGLIFNLCSVYSEFLSMRTMTVYLNQNRHGHTDIWYIAWMCYESPSCAMRMTPLYTPAIFMRMPTPKTPRLESVRLKCVEIGTRFCDGRMLGAPVMHRGLNFPTLNGTNIVRMSRGHGNMWGNKLGFDSSHGCCLCVFRKPCYRLNA